MTRENASMKADRLLLAGAVTVVSVDPTGVVAVVRGDSGLHRVQIDAGGQRSCTCEAGGRKCSHARAVSRVVAPSIALAPRTRAAGSGLSW